MKKPGQLYGAIVLAVCGLAACGLKGPLYLPQSETPKAGEPTAPAAPTEQPSQGSEPDKAK